MKIEIYGYSKSDTETLLKLKEITFCITPDQALVLGAFFFQCAEEMKVFGDSWDHKHFPGGGPSGDVIVSLLKKKKRRNK